MEKIPYKPGDVLVNRVGGEKTIFDLTQNGYVAILNNEDRPAMMPEFLTKKQLDDVGYTLKTPTPWRPTKEGEKYFYINIDEGYWVGEKYEFIIDDYRIKSGNCFRTREEVEEKYKEIMNRKI